MLQLTVDDVQLGVRVRDKADAIRAAGRLLVERGYIEAGYVDSMLGREEQANTYLGSGVAIPHGLGKDRGLIYRTGLSVLQLADVLEWNPGQPVSLVVGIAATSDDHIGILAALTDVLEDRQLSRRFVAAEPVEKAGARQVEVRIRGSDGLHARPAASFVDVARRFDAEIRVQYGGRTVNGKALASLLQLGAVGGAALCISATGPDAEAALAALRDALESGLGDEDEAGVGADGPTWTPPPGTYAVAGIPASPGVAVGPLFQFRSVATTRAERNWKSGPTATPGDAGMPATA